MLPKNVSTLDTLKPPMKNAYRVSVCSDCLPGFSMPPPKPAPQCVGTWKPSGVVPIMAGALTVSAPSVVYHAITKVVAMHDNNYPFDGCKSKPLLLHQGSGQCQKCHNQCIGKQVFVSLGFMHCNHRDLRHLHPSLRVKQAALIIKLYPD